VSKSTPALLQAIEGYAGEHTGQPEHEPNIKLLQRVKSEIDKGKGGDTITSPGRQEATAAAQKNMASEEGHDGGEGNKTTNRPGSFPGNEDVADPQDASKGPMSGTGPVPSDGHLRSNLTGEVARGGIVEMRRMAAAKGLEAGRTSEGNKDSNPPGKAPGNEKRVGDVSPSAKAPADRNTEGDGFEGVPPFAKETLSGDGWTRAREKARKLAPAAK
jgi:hypothetical protein